MKKYHDIDDMPLRGRIFLGLICLAAGAFPLAVSLGWVIPKPGSVHAPLWVLFSAGMVFVLAAILIMLGGRGRAAPLRHILAWCCLFALTLPFNWVAFGEGERHFRGVVSTGSAAISTPVSEQGGRWGFGIGAVLMDVVLLHLLLRGVRGRIFRHEPSGESH